MGPPSHTSTFPGDPLALAGVLAVLGILDAALLGASRRSASR